MVSAQVVRRDMLITDFGDVIAERIRAEHRALAERWFERLLDLLPVEARDIFPTESLLDHVPALILEISDYVRHPEDAAIAANTAILDKARELGALRHGQRASLHQVLREYQLLSRVLGSFVLEEIERLQVLPPPAACIAIVSRLHLAVDVLSQSTVEAFVTLYTQTIADQNERLEQFTRMAAHEWRQPLGALRFGVTILQKPGLDPTQADRTLAAVARNVDHLVSLTQKLEAVARTQVNGDNPVVQQVSARTVAQEAARQVREMADTRGVDIRIADDLPTLTVDVGRLELVLVNLLSNAIKYADPDKPDRFVEVSGATVDEQWCRLEVRDNGIGIPADALAMIFQRFTRVRSDRLELAHVAGVGLGLSIAEDCASAMGGHIDVRSTEREGSTFVLTVPRIPAVH
jgi:signal transduction histidine kinase